MAVTYFQTSDESDLTGPGGTGGTTRHLVASRTAGDGSTQLNSGNMNQNLFCHQNFITEAGDPGVDGDTGTFEVKVRCGAASVGETVEFRAFLYRLDSEGDPQTSAIESAEGGQSAVADTTRTFTWSSPSLGTWGAGDRLLVAVSIQNISGSMNQSARIEVDTSDDTIATPFTAGEPSVVDVDAAGETTATGTAALDVTVAPLDVDATGETTAGGTATLEATAPEPGEVEVDATGETTTGGEAAFRLTRGHLVELVVS